MLLVSKKQPLKRGRCGLAGKYLLRLCNPNLQKLVALEILLKKVG